MEKIFLIVVLVALVTSQSFQDVKEKQETECPTWFFPVVKNTSTWCECRDTIIQDGAVLRCPKTSNVLVDSQGRIFSKEHLNVSILSSFCMTHDFVMNQTVLASCPYNFHQPDSNFFLTLPSNVFELNDFMCGIAWREGELCNRCENSKGPDISVIKSKCYAVTKSLSSWLLYIGQIAVVPTIFFFVVLFCKLLTTTGPLNAFIFFSQGASVLLSIHRQEVHIALGISAEANWRSAVQNAVGECIRLFYNFWYNQCWGAINFSVSTKVSPFHVLALRYASALYPLLLILLCAIVIWMHSRGCKPLMVAWKMFRWFTSCFNVKYDPTSSIVHTFATFLLLIYTRILDVSFSLLAPTTVYNQSGELDYMVMPYDSSIRFMSRQHMPYVILSLSMLTVFCGLPLLFLFLYPMTCFQRLLNKAPVLFTEVLREFGKVYTGCYRDKTDPGRAERRYFASFYFLIRVIYFACFFFEKSSLGWLALIILPLLVSILFAAFQPYRRWWLNVVDSVAFALITLTTVLYAYNLYIARIPLWIPAVFVAVPFIYIVVLALSIAAIKVHNIVLTTSHTKKASTF